MGLNVWVPYHYPPPSSSPLAAASLFSVLHRQNVWELNATWTLRVRRSSLAELRRWDSRWRRVVPPVSPIEALRRQLGYSTRSVAP